MRRRFPSLLILPLAFAGSSALAAPPVRPIAPPVRPITLEVDASDVLRGIMRAHLVIPTKPGPLTLVYPKWIPGEHTPSGPLTQVVGLEIVAAGGTLAWHRDPRDAFSFQLDVPAGVSTIDVRFDFLSPPKAFGDGYGKTPNVTPHLLVLPFNHVLLYPLGNPTNAIPVKARVRIPSGWKFDCALHLERAPADTVELPEVSVTTLIDSPLLAGEHFRTIPLTEGAGATRISIAADTEAALAMGDAQVAAAKRLVAEANALYGARHYREYVWLIALGETLDRNGLEHHESTDIREALTFFTDASQRARWGGVLAHEYVHSWNGKYRRPAGMATPNYQEPMLDELLWVYEGMTRYLGDLVLRARTGDRTLPQAREYAAYIAAVMQRERPGRSWRSLGDTATAIPAYGDAPNEWTPQRRARDYYDEMLLVWLEADTILRQQTAGARSLDDLCRSFFGGETAVPSVQPYARADLEAALTALAPYDWHGFFASRVDAINLHAPIDGLANAGWKLVYDDTPNEYLAARESVLGLTDLSLPLGLWVKPDGSVADVVHGSPAFAANIAPGMRIAAVDGHKWSGEAARQALLKAEKTRQPLELVVEAADLVRTVRVDAHDGLRNPHLERDESRPDLLGAILAPLVAQP